MDTSASVLTGTWLPQHGPYHRHRYALTNESFASNHGGTVQNSTEDAEGDVLGWKLCDSHVVKCTLLMKVIKKQRHVSIISFSYLLWTIHNESLLLSYRHPEILQQDSRPMKKALVALRGRVETRRRQLHRLNKVEINLTGRFLVTGQKAPGSHGGSCCSDSATMLPKDKIVINLRLQRAGW